MRCPELRQLMSLKLDGCLSPAAEQLFETHLDACPACSQEWRYWQAIDDLFSAAPVVGPRVDLAARVMQRIPQRPRARAIGGSLLVMGLGMAVLAAFLLLPPALSFCGAAVAALQSPDLWPMAADACNNVLDIVTTVAEAARLLLWGALNSPSLAVAVAYTGLAGAMVAIWLRVVVFRRAPVHASARP